MRLHKLNKTLRKAQDFMSLRTGAQSIISEEWNILEKVHSAQIWSDAWENSREIKRFTGETHVDGNQTDS